MPKRGEMQIGCDRDKIIGELRQPVEERVNPHLPHLEGTGERYEEHHSVERITPLPPSPRGLPHLLEAAGERGPGLGGTERRMRRPAYRISRSRRHDA